MSDATNYLEKKLADHILGKAAYTMPVTVYLALFTADPTETGSLASEVGTGLGYARIAITADMSAANATTGTSVNSNIFTFGPASGPWGVVTHAALVDASSAGNVLAKAALTVSRNVQTGDSIQFAASQVSLTVA